MKRAVIFLTLASITLAKWYLTHWGRRMYICVSKSILIGPDNVCHLVGTKPFCEPMLKYCWTLSNKLQWNLNRYSHISILENAFENVVCEIVAMRSRPPSVKNLSICYPLLPFLHVLRILCHVLSCLIMSCNTCHVIHHKTSRFPCHIFDNKPYGHELILTWAKSYSVLRIRT